MVEETKIRVVALIVTTIFFAITYGIGYAIWWILNALNAALGYAPIDLVLFYASFYIMGFMVMTYKGLVEEC